MVNVGKVIAATVDYYVEQVAASAEEYYSARGEAQGMWLGSTAAAFGLSGDVKAAAFREVLNGKKPGEDTPLSPYFGRRKVLGIDTVFRAPKSVSLMYALGDPWIQEQVRAAHEDAVRTGFDYLERQVAWGRQGKAGVDKVEGEGLISAAWEHRTSRAGDPLLHTHVVTANMIRTKSGKWLTLDATRIYAHAKAAGVIYQAALRKNLSEELGVKWQEVKNGLADVEGVDREVIEAFSKRSREIEDELADQETSGSAKARQAATLQSRRAKEYENEDSLFDEWQAEAAAFGFTPTTVHNLCGLESIDPTWPTEASSIAQVSKKLDMTKSDSFFSRRDVIQAVADLASPLAGAETLERLADDWVERNALRVRDVQPMGVLGCRGSGEEAYTTRSHIKLEENLLEIAAGSLTKNIAASFPHQVLTVEDLNQGQAEAVRHVLRSHNQVDCIVGDAGTGKTHMLRRLKSACIESEWHVIGAAVSHRAKRELELGSGIKSHTIRRLLMRLEFFDARRVLAPNPNGNVLVIDEASMVSTRDLHDLLSVAAKVGTKVVLVGDEKQLPAIGAGGGFSAISQMRESPRLTENLRQRDEVDLSIADHLAAGDVDGAVDEALVNGRIEVLETADATEAKLVEDWIAACDPEGSLVLAATNREVDRLNKALQNARVKLGEISEERVVTPCGTFHDGDRVLFRKRIERHEIENGDFGTVIGFGSGGELEIDMDGGNVVEISQGELNDQGAMRLGYATTVHVAQGATFDSSFVLLSDLTSYEHAYVAFTRGRDSNRGYLPREALDAADEARAGHGAGLPVSDRTRVRQAIATRHSKQMVTLAAEKSVDSSAADRLVKVELLRTKPKHIVEFLQFLSGDAGPEETEAWADAALAVAKYLKKHKLGEKSYRLYQEPADPASKREWEIVHSKRAAIGSARTKAQAARSARRGMRM